MPSTATRHESVGTLVRVPDGRGRLGELLDRCRRSSGIPNMPATWPHGDLDADAGEEPDEHRSERKLARNPRRRMRAARRNTAAP